MFNYCVNNNSLHWNSQYHVSIHTYQTIEFHEKWKSNFELKLKARCIFYQTFNKGVHMNMSLYTSMSYTQIYVYYLIFQNEIFVTNFYISN